MSLSTAILLITSTAAGQSETFLLPPVPEDLPKAKTAPMDGHWVGDDGAKEESGVWLPSELSQDVLMRLKLLERTPAMCKERLIWSKKRCDVDIIAAVDIALADAGTERIEAETEPNGWPTWQVALIAVGASAVGASIGAAAISIYR